MKIIEEPMRVFRENKYISSLNDFVNTLKYFNSLLDTMVLFENAYLAVWKNSFDEARNGFKEHLLKKYGNGSHMFDVNADDK